MSAYGLLVTAVPIVPAATKQYARPSSDTSIVGWSPTPVYSRLFQPDNETLQSSATVSPGSSVGATGNATLEVGLGSISDPNQDIGHTIYIGHKTDVTVGSGTWTGVAKLKQGGTVIATWTIFPDGSGAYLQDAYTLSNAEAASITNYTALTVNVVWTLTNSAGGICTGHAFASWIELQTPLPLILVTSSASGIYESLQLISQTSIDIYEALAGYSVNQIELYELAGYAVGVSVVPYESVGFLSPTSIENYEALTGILQTSQENFEALGSYSTNKIELYELLGYATGVSIIVYESLGFLAIQSIENYESVGILIVTSQENYESLSSYNTSVIELYELLGVATGSNVVLWESLGYVAVQTIAIYEALTGLLAASIDNYEALGFWSPTRITLYELLGYATGVASNPYDTEQTIVAQTTDLYEALGFLIPNPQIPWEAEGTGYIVAQAYLYELVGFATGVTVSPYEALAAAIATALSVWEAEGTTYVLSQSYLYELIGFATGLAQQNYESTGPISNSGTVPWEAEALAVVTQNVIVPFEALQFLLVNNTGIFESTSDVLTVLNQLVINYEALSIDQFEGDTFILNSVTTDESIIDPGFAGEDGVVAIDGVCETGTGVTFTPEVASPMLVFPEQEYGTTYIPEKPVANPNFSDESVTLPSYNTVTPVTESFTDADTSTESNFTDS